LTLLSTISRGRQAVVVALALCAVVLGLVPLRPLDLLQIGRPGTAIVGLR
jgi:multicomponent Na+:H+ antiporter subunit D